MPKSPALLRLLDKMAPQVRKAFERSLHDITSDVLLKTVVDALEKGDVEKALRALHLGSEYFAPLDQALRDGYERGGQWAMASFVTEAKRQGANTVRARFDSRNFRAEVFLRTQSSRLITGLVEEQREMVRAVMVKRMVEGASPRSVALDIVGRLSKATGKREGGIIGLSPNQEQAARRAFEELRSGELVDLRSYLGRSLRDRRFDRVVGRAIRGGKAIGAKEAREIVSKYRGKLLRHRGETIARTELLGSLHEAKDEGLRQIVDKGVVADQDITKVWDASADSDTRESHRALDDAQANGSDGVFTTITGAQMRFPGDRSLGAPASEIINCRCVLHTRIDFLGAAKREGLL